MISDEDRKKLIELIIESKNPVATRDLVAALKTDAD